MPNLQAVRGQGSAHFQGLSNSNDRTIETRGQKFRLEISSATKWTTKDHFTIIPLSNIKEKFHDRE